jgi:hypothetical protein
MKIEMMALRGMGRTSVVNISTYAKIVGRRYSRVWKGGDALNARHND